MIFSFSNQKGGVGKTTTVLNLAAFLAEGGKRVLIIDLDPQANLTSGIGNKKYLSGRACEAKLSKEARRPSIYEVLLGRKTVAQTFVSTNIKNLFLLPSDLDLAGAEIELVNKLSRESLLKRALEGIENQYDYIFIDCPPSLGLLTINALVASERVIIPIQCEYFALEGVSQLLKTIQLIKNNINRTLQLGGVVLTMFDARTRLSKAIEEEVNKFFKGKVFNSVIPRNVKLSEAPSYGQPITIYDRLAPGFTAYKNLADEFKKRFN